MGVFKAVPDDIYSGAGKLGEVESKAGELESGHQDVRDRYGRWWGKEGSGDQFADQVGPGFDAEDEQIAETLGIFAMGSIGFVEGVRSQGDAVQRPQQDAIDDMDSIDSDFGDAGDLTGRR